jgi:FecR protein
MKTCSRILLGSVMSVAFLLPAQMTMAAAKEARVTQIIREVKLLPSKAAERAAAVNDKVSEDTGVRTGGDSRSELTFPDLTITRLGSNTIFSFTKAGHTAKVDSGSILLRVPKNSGGGTIQNNAVTVAITGTTVIFEGSRGTKSKLITLEGSARVSLRSKPGDPRNVLAGQMLDVPAGATTLPMPVNIDLNDVMRNHPLITDFKPLPSRPLILAAAQQQAPAPPPPRRSGPNISIDIFGGGLNVGPRRRRPPNQPPPGPNDPSGNQPPKPQGNKPKPKATPPKGSG